MPRHREDTDAVSESGASEQLELFVTAGAPSSRSRGLDPAIARASVSPGWWPLVRPLFYNNAGIEVQECRETDGLLALQASAIHDDEDSSWLDPLLERVRDACARTCACCGSAQAARYADRVAAVIRAVCSTCRGRLEGGEAYLDLVDSFWRFDGTRRLRPSPMPSGMARARRATAGATQSAARECTVLRPEELRETIRDIADAMRAEIVGQDDAVHRVALLAGLHVGARLARGGRALIVGPSGVGKSSIVLALRRALEALRFDVPFVMTNAGDLTSPGWSGAPSIGDLLEAAFAGAAPDSARARHAVVVLDEIHHVGVVDGLHGNMFAKRQEVLASLLPLVGYGSIHLGEGTREWSSQNALVIALGAFTGPLDTRRAPTPADLVRAGLPLELATRFEEVITLKALPERQLNELLHRWPALQSLVGICEGLGYTVRIHEEAFTRSARAVVLGDDGSTARTAGGWLVGALRQALIAALADEAIRELEITPDSLAIARTSTRRDPPDDPPDSGEWWDATIVLRPR